MRYSNPMQLRAFIKQKSVTHKISAQIVLQNYVMERLLERLSRSVFSRNFIIKGGFLIAAIVGLNSRGKMNRALQKKKTASDLPEAGMRGKTMPKELLLTTKFWIVFGIICFFLSCIAYLYYEGMPFTYIYKRKTVYITPWKDLLSYWLYIIPIAIPLCILLKIITKDQMPLYEALYVGAVNGVVGSFIAIHLIILGCRKGWVKVRISFDKLIIHYYDLQKWNRVHQYYKLKVNTEDIKNIEYIYIPDLLMDNKIRVNRQLDETYNVTVSSYDNPERATDGIDITLSNGKHIVFETDDAENCINVLRRVTGL